MKYQDFLKKSFQYNELLSEQELGQNITEAAFNTSSLMAEYGQVFTDNPTYRNVYVTHPSISDLTEDGGVPSSTVQTYSTTESDFKKVGSKIELTNEVLTIPKWDIQSNTSMLSGKVLANKIAELAVADLASRQVLANPTTEEILTIESGIPNDWGSSTQEVYALLVDALKLLPDVYDGNIKFYLNRNNFAEFISLVQDNGLYGVDQVWVVQNGLLFGRYEIVICDQLDDKTMYLGDMRSAFDVVSMSGNQVVDPFTVPDILQITSTNKYAFVAKDTAALVGIIQTPTP